MKKVFFILLVFVLLAIYVWPTRYQQYEPGEGPYAAEVPLDASTRIDRITGDIALLNASGEWKIIGNTRKALAFQRPDVDPHAAIRTQGNANQRVVDEKRNTVEQTQQAVDAATQ